MGPAWIKESDLGGNVLRRAVFVSGRSGGDIAGKEKYRL